MPPGHPLDVAYEDADVIVVNKPVGMVVHPAAGHPTAHWSTLCYITVANHLSGINGPPPRHRPPHSTGTPRAAIAAKNDSAHQALAAQLQDHSLTGSMRRCAGACRRHGTVDAPIGRHPTDRKKMCVD